MTSPVEFKTATGVHWSVVAEESGSMPNHVWMHFTSTSASLWSHLTPAQARAIAHALTVAADDAEMAAQPAEVT